MQTFKVGGAVRDTIMGLTPSDNDWVVVGSYPDELLAKGFTQVGKDFPVFLHPETKDEWALARTERKSGSGYKGFTVNFDRSVTLEEDLMRRDLTMNAIAQDEHGNYVDPYGGIEDIKNKVIRHVSDSFKEDPVRVLRVARFAARYQFTVHPDTMSLMKEMVASGEVDHLVSERVWQEFAKGLMEAKPSTMFETLRECGALKVIFPELDALWGVPQRPEHHPEVDTGIHTMMVIDMASRLGFDLSVRFACLVHDLGKGTTPAEMLPKHHGHEQRSRDLAEAVSARLRVPNEIRELALLNADEHTNIHRSEELNHKALNRLFERCGAYKFPVRFKKMLQACEADARGRATLEERPYTPASYLGSLLDHVLGMDMKAVSAQAIAHGLVGEKVGAFIRSSRVLRLRAIMKP